MPGFSSLTDKERWDVVGYSLTLSLDAPAVSAAEEAYSQACADCHGPSGGGGERGPALARVELLASNSRADLFQTITDGRGPAMPGFAESLAEETRWALAGYLQTLGGEVSAAGSAGNSPNQEEPQENAIVGQIVNGTPGSSVSSGMDVTLHGFDGQEEVLTEVAKTAGDGSYHFEDLDVVDGRLFIISVEYGGIRYASDIGHLTGSEDPLELPVAVYESTTEPSAVHADQIHVLLDYPQPDSLRVIELWVIRNLGDRTLASFADGGGIEIPLPAGAENLRFEDSQFAERYQAVPGGFSYGPALRPGNEGIQIVFSFDLPYPRALMFDQKIPYDVSMVTILAPEAGPTIRAAQMEDRGARQVTGQVVHQYDLDLPSGEPLQFEIRGRAPGDTFLPQGVDQNLFIGAGAFLLALAGLGIWLKPWRRGESSTLEPDGALAAPSSGDQQRLLTMIAELDDSFENGALEEAEYHLRRKSLKNELMNLLQETQGS